MRLLLVIVLVFSFVACGPRSQPSTLTQPAGPVLYDRIGRMDVIKDIVKDFIEQQLMKGELAARFVNVNTALLADNLATQLCELSGGPCKYAGRSMREAHAELAITEADFTAFVGALEQSLVKYKIDAKAQSELIALVRKHRDDVVAQ
ncbi:MAG TPA: group 1 truncated hemoglobin [Kofleriaceae bacterium]